MAAPTGPARSGRPDDGLPRSSRGSHLRVRNKQAVEPIRGEMKRLLTLRNLAAVVVLGAALGFAVFWVVTIPATVPASALTPYTPNVANGKTMFNIGGCASCHAVPDKDPKKVDHTRLGGGVALGSPVGTFYAPHISPEAKDGIGAWSEADFVTAMWDGTAPDGSHLFSAFPYDSYP